MSKAALQPLSFNGFTVFFLTLAAFFVYHVSHGFPRLNVGARTTVRGIEVIDF